jgi:hypothetical protein
MGQKHNRRPTHHAFAPPSHGGHPSGPVPPAAPLSEAEPPAVCWPGEVAESTPGSWESAWIDLGGEG